MWHSRSKPEKQPFFEWSERDHSVGVAAFDHEHRHLAAMMARIHEALEAEHNRLLAVMLMERLVKETRIHFTHEESAMEEANFPERDAHAAEHTALIAQAEHLLHQYTLGSVSATMLPSFLRDWLIPHMLDYDRKYSGALGRPPGDGGPDPAGAT